MTDAEFRDYYVKQLGTLGVRYKGNEFLYPHNPPWPQQPFDYPYGQAPEVDDLPPEETADWERFVQTHYLNVAFGSGSSTSIPLADQATAYMEQRFITNGFRMYPDIGKDDVVFTAMLCEGLFSKFLCPLDDVDKSRFSTLLTTNTTTRYWKIDLSCMQVIHYEAGLFVAPAVAVVKQKQDGQGNWLYHDQGGYELVGIDIWNDVREQNSTPPPLTPPATAATNDQKELWRRSKYFVLHGCMHRINLLDHVKVHFPHDTINAITKSVLPKWHVVYQLLLPHFWLTLPVNNAVLEGPRSLINRDTWYPWNPFATNGKEFRKLLPFSWAGNEYYHPGNPNSAFPGYQFPTGCPDATASRYRWYQSELYGAVSGWVTAVLLAALGQPPGSGDPNHAWLEIKRWAHEIARFIPNFPDEDGICKPSELNDAITQVIWNASVVHSFDHSAITQMMNDETKPMPFVMRVPFDGPQMTLGTWLGPGGADGIGKKVDGAYTAFPILAGLISAQDAKDALINAPLDADSLPLCWPADVLYAKMTDSLFYVPHNSSLLYNCRYAFVLPDASPTPPNPFPGRPYWLDDGARSAIKSAHDQLQNQLRSIDHEMFGGTSTVARDLDLPHPMPPDDKPPGFSTWTDADKQAFGVRYCVGAGIQY